MAIKHTIAQEVYTNSVLISPVSEDQPLQQFFWRRRNCYFSRNFEQKIIQVEKQLTYQCSILDYATTIELVTIDQQNGKTLYSYGPVKLQPELLTYPSLPAPHYPITLYLDGKHVPAHLAFEPAPSFVYIHLALPNNRQITLRYPETALHQGCLIFTLDAIPSSHMLLTAPEDPNAFKFLLEDLHISSKQPPKAMEVRFEDQFTRDLCGLQILIAMGYQFEGVRCETTLKLWKTHYRYQNQQTIFEKLNDSHLQLQLNGLFPMEAVHPPPRQITNETLYQFQHLLDSPKGNRQSLKNFNPEKMQREFLNGYRGQEVKNKKSESPSSPPTSKTKGRKKMNMNIQKTGKIPYCKVQPSKKINRLLKVNIDDPFIRQKYLISLRRNEQLEEQNKRLKQMNQELMKKVKQYEKKTQKKKNVPGFIKQLEINKAIKKVAHTTHEPKVLRYIHKESPKRSEKNSQKNSEKSSMAGDSRLKTWNVSKLLNSGKGLSITSHSPPQSEKGRQWEWKEPDKDKRSSMKSLGMKFFLNFQSPGREKGQSQEKEKKSQWSKGSGGWKSSKPNKTAKNDNM